MNLVNCMLTGTCFVRSIFLTWVCWCRVHTGQCGMIPSNSTLFCWIPFVRNMRPLPTRYTRFHWCHQAKAWWIDLSVAFHIFDLVKLRRNALFCSASSVKLSMIYCYVYDAVQLQLSWQLHSICSLYTLLISYGRDPKRSVCCFSVIIATNFYSSWGS